ncbi:unnamed protein product [Rangifer tarandus platyrhynchus]|uniref:Uncharacterized protein n=2 Tax=Rangifer tarandus platyrhynchus TaxID=3082113 RepID=A0AC59ZDR8_RANTA|nr:unnamed protein product [Rangifer tarandus platyrhynchus]
MIQKVLCRKTISTPEIGTTVLVLIIICAFSDLKFSLGWCNNTLPYKIQFGLLLVSLGQEHELCQEVFFSHEWIPLMQLTGEIVLLLPQLTKGAFVQHQNC